MPLTLHYWLDVKGVFSYMNDVGVLDGDSHRALGYMGDYHRTYPLVTLVVGVLDGDSHRALGYITYPLN